MFFIRRRLLAVILVALVLTSTAYAETRNIDIKALNLTPPIGGPQRRILLLNFNSSRSNITNIQAARAMDNFFDGNTSYGSYIINLNWEYSHRGDFSEAVEFMAWFGVGLTLGIGLVFLPTDGQAVYRLSANLQILDTTGKIVKDVTKSKTLSRLEGHVLQNSVSRVSRNYSSLLHEIRDEINRDYITINNQLRSPALSPEIAVEKLFNTLSANIPNNFPIAVLQIAGTNTAERLTILNALETRFVNSSKRYTVVSRNNLAPIYVERLNQISSRIDTNTVFQIGREIGARIVVEGEYRIENNQKTLWIRATDIQTLQVYGSAFVIY
jgi:hypothetical protein